MNGDEIWLRLLMLLRFYALCVFACVCFVFSAGMPQGDPQGPLLCPEGGLHPRQVLQEQGKLCSTVYAFPHSSFGEGQFTCCPSANVRFYFHFHGQSQGCLVAPRRVLVSFFP